MSNAVRTDWYSWPVKRQEPLSIRLDRESELPLGVQLAWHLRAAMASGELGAGAAPLERRPADPGLQRRLATGADDPLAAQPAVPGGRLLSAAELESIRDELAERLALLEDAERVAAEPEPAPGTQHSTAPRA